MAERQKHRVVQISLEVRDVVKEVAMITQLQHKKRGHCARDSDDPNHQDEILVVEQCHERCFLQQRCAGGGVGRFERFDSNIDREVARRLISCFEDLATNAIYMTMKETEHQQVKLHPKT
jgi:hypothetical protein